MGPHGLKIQFCSSTQSPLRAPPPQLSLPSAPCPQPEGIQTLRPHRSDAFSHNILPHPHLLPSGSRTRAPASEQPSCFHSHRTQFAAPFPWARPNRALLLPLLGLPVRVLGGRYCLIGCKSLKEKDHAQVTSVSLPNLCR